MVVSVVWNAISNRSLELRILIIVDLWTSDGRNRESFLFLAFDKVSNFCFIHRIESWVEKLVKRLAVLQKLDFSFDSDGWLRIFLVVILLIDCLKIIGVFKFPLSFLRKIVTLSKTIKRFPSHNFFLLLIRWIKGVNHFLYSFLVFILSRIKLALLYWDFRNNLIMAVLLLIRCEKYAKSSCIWEFTLFFWVTCFYLTWRRFIGCKCRIILDEISMFRGVFLLLGCHEPIDKIFIPEGVMSVVDFRSVGVDLSYRLSENDFVFFLWIGRLLIAMSLLAAFSISMLCRRLWFFVWFFSWVQSIFIKLKAEGSLSLELGDDFTFLLLFEL